eukprot:CAMPEP_0202688068 /NCGR_PEP_ID=MMETSP1385-20130828/3596_1 /ASSEMBLY_ACC=CAM_ASM_000861 /TAXON_ID=933848 /ORGANISM="Elphidium margaritaceum" /LENGTH=334 /DNA_ID=CAMNT_0049342949 /DNA_START=215 /DNA_END=1219 /DNA_ORIENTATION=+
MTCECSKHGIGYAVLHYSVWLTIGHPYICHGLLIVFFNVFQMIDILSEEKTCVTGRSLSSSAITIYNYGYIVCTLLYIIIVFPAGIVVFRKTQQDVTFQLHWKEQSVEQRQKAASIAIKSNAETFVYKGPSDPNLFASKESNVNKAAEDVAMDPEELAFGDVDMAEFANNQQANHEKRNSADVGNNLGTPRMDSAGDNAADEAVIARQDTEEQLRLAIAASLETAEQEEQNRTSEMGNNNQSTTTALNDAPAVTRNASVSMTGFWARKQQISSALMGTLFKQSEIECVVCYDEYTVGQEIAKLQCGHHMHRTCAKEWLAHNPTCPFCRVNVVRG